MQAIAVPQPQRWALPIMVSALLIPVGLQAQQPEKYSISGSEVAIYNLAGEIRIEPGTGAVTVEAARGGADAGKLKVLRGEVQDREALRFIYPADRIQYARLGNGSSTQLRVRDDGTFGYDRDEDRKPEGRRVTIARNGGLDAYADLRVTVPSGKRVAIYLAVGKASVTNVDGELSVYVSSAPVTASGTRGDLDIDVGSGAVQVTQARGNLRVDTGSGSVGLSDIRGQSVTVETGSGGVTASDLRSNELSVETGSGDIQVTGLTAPQVSLQTGSGSVAADLSGEVWNVSVETGSGDITLKAPATLGAEVDIETSSGDIETDFEVAVTRHARDHMTGRIGDGRGKIAIETGSGGIKLVKGQ
jgi:lia operon protein LiaG